MSETYQKGLSVGDRAPEQIFTHIPTGSRPLTEGQQDQPHKPPERPPTTERSRSDEEADRQHPLKKFSLRGVSAHLERMAAEQVPLLDSILLSGQANTWYAPPNTGKSLLALALLTRAIEDGRIRGDDVIYVNVDDTSRGLAEKTGLNEQFNVHTLGEGERQFTARALVPAMRKLIEEDRARGLFIILDTLKKFVSLMDKKDSAEFATLCRQFVLKGGTLLCLGHTNKRPGSDGKLIYSGTSDIVDDFDCAYIIGTRPDQPSETERVIEFQNIKKRGDVDDRAVFSYSVREKIGYDQRLASVTKLDANGFLPIDEAITHERETAVISAIAGRIAEGPIQKMQLAREVSATIGLGRHKVIDVIDRYTGDDPQTHRWNFVIRARGMKLYYLVGAPPPAHA